MKIALVSLNQHWENKKANKSDCLKFISQSVESEVDIIVFPEMTLTGFSMNTKLTAEDINNSDSINWFKAQAAKYSIAVIFGVVLKYEEKAKNHLFFIDNDGEVIANYAKIHPFSYSTENEYFVGGNDIISTVYKDISIGFTICYDLRFPEIYQALSKTCDIIVNIANWPQKRSEHWSALLKARSIENQVFMIGVNRTGTDGNNIEYRKSSTIFSPDGSELTPAKISEELDIFELEVESAKKLRELFPVKKDRKIDLYKRII